MKKTIISLLLLLAITCVRAESWLDNPEKRPVLATTLTRLDWNKHLQQTADKVSLGNKAFYSYIILTQENEPYR